MYIVGKYKYENKVKYEFLLIKVMITFAFLYVFLNILKNQMYSSIYWSCVLICVAMIAHLWMRFLHAENILNYSLNEY